MRRTAMPGWPGRPPPSAGPRSARRPTGYGPSTWVERPPPPRSSTRSCSACARHCGLIPPGGFGRPGDGARVSKRPTWPGGWRTGRALEGGLLVRVGRTRRARVRAVAPTAGENCRRAQAWARPIVERPDLGGPISTARSRVELIMCGISWFSVAECCVRRFAGAFRRKRPVSSTAFPPFVWISGQRNPRGAKRSPCVSTRRNTSSVSKRSRSGSRVVAHLCTSAEVTGVDTVGVGMARTE